MAYSAKILTDCISPEGVRLTTFEATFPRMILAEINTHRMLSRNSASSRAIPVAKSIEAVRTDPFIPEEFGANRPGMSWKEELGINESAWSLDAWKSAMNHALGAAGSLERWGVHKSLANRLLEPFKWHTAIISATEWGNFFALRTDENAQPEFRKIALMMQELYEAVRPVSLPYRAWTLPLVKDEEILDTIPVLRPDNPSWSPDYPYWKKVSTGRCARVSYLTHDGKRDPDKDIELHDRLLSNTHPSPFEHIARPLEGRDRNHPSVYFKDGSLWCGNFRGWFQYRAEIPNESDFSKVIADEAG